VADVNGDGLPDIITVPTDAAAEVKVFLNTSTGSTVSFQTTPFRDFLAFPSTYISGGVLAAADMGSKPANGPFTNTLDGKAEIVVGSGPGMPATVEVFDVSGTPTLVQSFTPFGPSFNGGVFLSAGQIIHGPANTTPSDIVVGAGVMGGSQVEAWAWNTSNASLYELGSFVAFTGAGNYAAVHVATQTNSQGIVDAILAVQGPGGASGQIRTFNITSVSPFQVQQGTPLNGFNCPYFIATTQDSTPNLITTMISPASETLSTPAAKATPTSAASPPPPAKRTPAQLVIAHNTLLVDKLFAALGSKSNLDAGISSLLGPIKPGLA
jgi:hypothetical protein